jgi:hypothetical protein
MYWLRGPFWAVLALAGVGVYAAMGKEWSVSRLLNPRRIMQGIILVSLGLVFFSPLFKSLGTYFTSRLFGPFLESFAQSQATVAQFIDFTEILSIRNLLILFLRGIFSPSPLRFIFDTGQEPILEVAITSVWYILLPFAVVGVLGYRRRGSVVATAIVAILIFVGASASAGLGGEIVRHRIPMFALFYVLAAGGTSADMPSKYRWVVLGWGVSAIAFTVVWMVLRL